VDQRRAERRAALIDASIEVYGQLGYRNASVKAVCTAAGLTERYFYESFASSDELLAAAYQTVSTRVREELSAAAAAAGSAGALRAMLHAYYAALRARPDAARVFLVEIGGVSPKVDAVVREVVSDWIALMAPTIAPRPSGAPPELLAAGIFGGVTQIALEWIATGYCRPLAQVVEAALEICALGQAGEASAPPAKRDGRSRSRASRSARR
jgi:AcrR family transcriptional regulator